jgi:hypothetical protein
MPHNQMVNEGNHAQKWHSDHSSPRLLENHLSEKTSLLSQQLHEKTEAENSLDGWETPQNECTDTRAYIHLPTMCESHCDKDIDKEVTATLTMAVAVTVAVASQHQRKEPAC